MLEHSRIHALLSLATFLAVSGCDPGYVGDLDADEAEDSEASAEGTTGTTHTSTTGDATATTELGSEASTAMPAPDGGDAPSSTSGSDGEESTTVVEAGDGEESTSVIESDGESSEGEETGEVNGLPADCFSLIDDFADGDAVLPAIDGRQGVWSTFGEGSFEPRPGTPFAPVSGGRISAYAAQVRGFGPDGLMGLEVTLNGGEPYDASMYDGIMFHVRSALPLSNFDVYYGSRDMAPLCTDLYCKDAANFVDGGLSADPEGHWDSVVFPQTTARYVLETYGQGYYEEYFPRIAEDLELVDPSEIRSIRFIAPRPSQGFDITIDAICFLEGGSL